MSKRIAREGSKRFSVAVSLVLATTLALYGMPVMALGSLAEASESDEAPMAQSAPAGDQVDEVVEPALQPDFSDFVDDVDVADTAQAEPADETVAAADMLAESGLDPETDPADDEDPEAAEDILAAAADGDDPAEEPQDVEDADEPAEEAVEAPEAQVVRDAAEADAASDQDANARATYRFYADGELVAEQVVAQGDILREPGVPETGANREFKGWYVDEDGEQVKVDFVEGALEIDSVSEGAVVRVDAVFQQVCYVAFHAGPIGNADAEKVQQQRKVDAGSTLDIEPVRAAAPTANSIFVSWQDAEGTAYAGEITVNEDLDLYPAFKDAHWINFVSGEVGTGATYIAPRYVTVDDVVNKLAVPELTGYIFQGWRKGSLDGDFVTDAEGNVIVPGGRLELESDLTLYAGWKATTTTFSIVIWKQKVTDDVDYNIDHNDAAKSYDYAGTAKIEILSGNKVDANEYLNISGHVLNVKDSNLSGIDLEGFELNENNSNLEGTVSGDGTTVLNVRYDRQVVAINFNGYSGRSTKDGGGAPDKSIFYIPVTAKNYAVDGSEVTVRGWDGGKYVSYTTKVDSITGEDGTVYSTYVKYQGLYGAPLEFEWPTSVLQEKTSNGARSTLTVAWGAYLSSDAVPFTNTTTTLRGSSWNQLHTATATSYTQLNTGYPLDERVQYDCFIALNREVPKVFYKQNLDGTWPAEDDFAARFLWIGGNFIFDPNDDSYEGFKCLEWSQTAGVWSKSTSQVSIKQKPNPYGVHVRYERQKYSIDFVDPTDGSSKGSIDNIKYETPLDADVLAGNASKYYTDVKVTGKIPADPTREGYTFSGWYADEACTQLMLGPAADGAARENHLIGNTMPAANLALYAGWETNWYRIDIDPAGGELQDSQSTYFWLKYGGRIEEYANITRTYVEDASGSYYYHYDRYSGVGNGDGNRKAYYSASSEDSTEGGTAYRQVPEGEWKLVGWYRVGDDGSLTPYNFNTLITGEVKLRAVWSRTGEYKLAYDAAEGSGAPVDEGEYADKAAAVVAGAPADVPEGRSFMGWELAGTLYLPGDVVTIDAELADDTVVTLTAVYADQAGLVSVALDANNDESAEDPAGLDSAPDNSSLTLPELMNTISRIFKGWAASADADEARWLAGDVVYANAGGKTFAQTAQAPVTAVLYAVWADKPVLVVTADSGEKLYDGDALTPFQLSDGTGEDAGYTVSGELAEGDWLASVEVAGSQVDPGTSASTASGAVILRALEDGTTVDVTDLYLVLYVDGALTVNAEEVLDPQSGEEPELDPEDEPLAPQSEGDPELDADDPEPVAPLAPQSEGEAELDADDEPAAEPEPASEPEAAPADEPAAQSAPAKTLTPQTGDVLPVALVCAIGLAAAALLIAAALRLRRFNRA